MKAEHERLKKREKFMEDKAEWQDEVLDSLRETVCCALCYERFGPDDGIT